MATQKLYDKFYDFTIPPNSNPIEAVHVLEDTNNQMAEKAIGIPDTFLHARFVRTLPDEYSNVKATLQAMKNRDRARSSVWSARGTPPCPRRRGRSGRPGRPSKRSSRVKAAAGEVCYEVVAAIAGAPRTVAAVGAAARVEVAAAEEAVAAPVVPAVVATDLLAAVGDATGGATSGKSAPRRRVTFSSSVLGARVLAARRAYAHRARRCW